MRPVPITGVDGGFLYAESASQPSTVLAVFSLDGPPVTLPALTAHVAGRLHLVPWLRQVLRTVPFGIGHPVAEADDVFDLGHHVREVTLPVPGGAAQLDELAASLAARRLDRRHPLWRLVLVHGLDGGRQAVILLVHHALVDGVALRTVLERLFGPVPPTATDAHEEPARSTAATRVVAALAALARVIAGLPRLIVDTSRALRAIDRRRATAAVAVPGRDDTPPCAVNRGFDARRVTSRATVERARFTDARDATGTSLNDVLLAAVGGGLRRVLGPDGLLPDRPLTASIPVSLDPPDTHSRVAGNRVTTVTTTLATDEPDPAARCRRISEVTTEALAQLRAGDPSLPARWLELAVPAIAEPAMRMWARRRRAQPDRADYNVLVSNVRGPAGDLRIGPARIGAVHQSGPTFDGAGVNITATSVGDRVDLAVLAHPDALPDPAALLDGVRAELDRLAAGTPPPAP